MSLINHDFKNTPLSLLYTVNNISFKDYLLEYLASLANADMFCGRRADQIYSKQRIFPILSICSQSEIRYFRGVEEHMQQQANDILERIEKTLQEKKTVAPVLDQILMCLGGKAIGLWCCSEGKLCQIGFRAVSEMDEQVRKQFAALTQEVPLENTGLGIVKAIVDKKPAIGTLHAGKSGLQGSSEWLRKFEAQQSYAVPIFEGDQVVGVLAISTNCIHQTGDIEWVILTEIAEGIGEKKLLGMF